jgi:hypothetical protein
MATIIQQYTLMDLAEQTLSLPASVNFLRTGNLATGEMCLWAEVPDDPAADTAVFSFVIFRVGDTFYTPLAFMGMVVDNAGDFCFVYMQ